MCSPISSARASARLAGGDRLHPADRQPAQVDGKDHDEHEAEPEAGHGIDGDRSDREQPVAPASRPGAGDDAERRAEPEGERGGKAHEEQRVRQPLQHDVEHRPLEGRGPAEIEPQEGGRIGDEPLQRALVEAPLRAQLGDAFRVGAAGSRQIGVDRVAGRRLEQQKGAERDDDQDRDGADERGGGEERTRVARLSESSPPLDVS